MLKSEQMNLEKSWESNQVEVGSVNTWLVVLSQGHVDVVAIPSAAPPAQLQTQLQNCPGAAQEREAEHLPVELWCLLPRLTPSLGSPGSRLLSLLLNHYVSVLSLKLTTPFVKHVQFSLIPPKWLSFHESLDFRCRSSPGSRPHPRGSKLEEIQNPCSGLFS